MKSIKPIDLDDVFDKPFTFMKRPEHLPCEMRPLWKCSLVLIILEVVGRNKSSSLKKLHVINWILKSERNVTDFLFWNSSKNGIKPEIRLDPTLDRALELLICDNFLIKNADKFSITENADVITQRIMELDVFLKEKELLRRLKRNLSEANVNKIFQVR